MRTIRRLLSRSKKKEEEAGTSAVREQVEDFALQELFQWLFDETHRSVSTRERHGQPLPRRLEIISIQEVQNDTQWAEYRARREELRAEMRGSRSEDRRRLATDTGRALERAESGTMISSRPFEARVPKSAPPGSVFHVESPYSGRRVEVAVLEGVRPGEKVMVREQLVSSLPGPPIAKDVNEALLFHGTGPLTAESIADSCFRLSHAGSGRGTLYGRGLYFAESCTKADEYAVADGNGIHTIIVSRVLLGRPLYTTVESPDTSACETLCREGAYHSLVGDRRQCRGTFREFVVFHECQVFVNYVVRYRRVF